MRVLLLIMGLVCQFLGASDATSELEAIPVADRAALSHLFRWLAIDQDFAYTLFGDRAVAYAAYRKDRRGRKVESALQVWDQYRHLFPSSNFELVVRESKRFPSIHLF